MEQRVAPIERLREVTVIAVAAGIGAPDPRCAEGPEHLLASGLVGRIAKRGHAAARGATVALFSKTLGPQFADIPKQIEELVHQARPEAADERIAHGRLERGHHRQRRCERCNQVIPHRLGVCPACLESRKLQIGRAHV